MLPIFKPKRGELDYRGAYGGRGSAKSYSFALMAAVWGQSEKLRILCTREYQNSIKESFHAELKAAITDHPFLAAHYDVGVDYLRGKNGTEFIFRGLRHNMTAVKSLAKIDLCIVEEAEDVPQHSWRDLLPTIREPKAEVWVIWNPRDEGSPTDERFRLNPPPRSRIVEMNWRDNPKFPPRLERQRQHDLNSDPDLYHHIWEGKYWSKSDAQVLAGRWKVEDFSPKSSWDGPYFGQDWGFAADPTTLIKFWRHENKLYVEKEEFGIAVEVTDLPAFNERIDGASAHVIRADSARPELISHMQQHGFPKMIAAQKWPGSVEDGVTWLRSHEIIIHPDCPKITEEARMWSYKTDRKSGDVQPALKSGFDHGWDAVRYGAAPMIKQGVRAVTTEKKGIEPVARYRHKNNVWISDTAGNLKVWEEPVRQYVVGAILKKTALGGAAIQVVDHASGLQVACWQGEVSLEGFAPLVADVCRRYGNAWAVIDIDTNTVPVGALLKIHKRVYSAMPVGYKTGKIAGRREFGFHADHHIGRLLDQLSSDMETKRDGIQDADTIQELNNIRLDEMGVVIDTAIPCERVWALCLARHGANTLPKPRTPMGIEVKTQSSAGWGGHV